MIFHQSIKRNGLLFQVSKNRVDAIILIVLSISVCLIELFNNYHTEVLCISFLIFLRLETKKIVRLNHSNRTVIVYSLLYLIIPILYRVLGVSSCETDAIAQYINWAIILIYGTFIFVVIDNVKLARSIFWLFFSLTAIQIVVVALSGFQSFKQGIADTSNLRVTEYGSMVLFFSSICFLLFLHVKRKKRILFLFFFLLSNYVIFFVMQRATDMLISLVLFFLILIANSRQKKSTRFIFIVVVVLVVIGYYFKWYLYFIDFLIAKIPSARIRERLEAFNLFLLTGDFNVAGGFSGRTELYENSIRSWLRNGFSFFFFLLDHRWNNQIIGNHSDLFDNLGRFGIMGLFIILKLNISAIKNNLEKIRYSHEVRNQVFMIYFVFLIRNIIGTTSFYIVGIQIFVLLPLSFFFLRENPPEDVKTMR